MVLGLYLWSKPHGGGPAPLIFNPVSYLLAILVLMHVLLFILSSGSFAFPFIADISCPALQTNSTYCAVCTAVTFATTVYLSTLGCKTWGTETEWTYASIVTMTVAVADLCVAGWGIQVWVTSSQAFFHVEGKEMSESCRSTKAYAFYSITACVISVNVTVAIFCSVVSVLLTKRVNSQLEELRRLV